MNGQRAKILRKKARKETNSFKEFKKEYKRLKQWWKSLSTPEKQIQTENL